MKTYRDRARVERGISPAGDDHPRHRPRRLRQGGPIFNIKPVCIPVDSDFRADVAATRAAINRNTIVVVGSAPCFPYGVSDPIAELSELARERGVGFHTDACLGRFLLPWAADLATRCRRSTSSCPALPHCRPT